MQKKQLLIIAGPAEPEIAARIERELTEGRPILAKSLSLELLAAILARSELFVGNDSGIAHLAAALGIPAVVLFGPTLPQHWAPLGPDVKILRDPCLENITVEDVIRNLKCGSLPALS